MASIPLARTGQHMPIVGFGMWKLDPSISADMVYTAIKAGYRMFDGAGNYGNEKEAGEGVRRAINEGLVKREELFITSKLWCTFHAKEHVKAQAQRSLDFWGLDYFDLFLVHFPIALQYIDPAELYPPAFVGTDGKTVTLQDTPMRETWAAMEGLVDTGLARNIGICNTQGSLLIDILRYAHHAPQVLEIERHPYLSQEPLVALAKALGIAVIAYSPFGPQGYYEMEGGQGARSLMEVEGVRRVAGKYGRTPAQILLRWSTQRGIAVIPKSSTEARAVENLGCKGFDLTEEDMEVIDGLNRNLRMNNPVDVDPRLAIFA